MSEESIKNPPRSGNIFVSSLIDNRPLLYAKSGGNCLRLSSISVLKNVVNLYISYTLHAWPKDLRFHTT